jgi:hypothetical protein
MVHKEFLVKFLDTGETGHCNTTSLIRFTKWFHHHKPSIKPEWLAIQRLRYKCELTTETKTQLPPLLQRLQKPLKTHGQGRAPDTGERS